MITGSGMVGFSLFATGVVTGIVAGGTSGTGVEFGVPLSAIGVVTGIFAGGTS